MYLNNLPTEILLIIVSHIQHLKTLHSFVTTCILFYQLYYDDKIWKHLFYQVYGKYMNTTAVNLWKVNKSYLECFKELYNSEIHNCIGVIKSASTDYLFENQLLNKLNESNESNTLATSYAVITTQITSNKNKLLQSHYLNIHNEAVLNSLKFKIKSQIYSLWSVDTVINCSHLALFVNCKNKLHKYQKGRILDMIILYTLKEMIDEAQIFNFNYICMYSYLVNKLKAKCIDLYREDPLRYINPQSYDYLAAVCRVLSRDESAQYIKMYTTTIERDAIRKNIICNGDRFIYARGKVGKNSSVLLNSMKNEFMLNVTSQLCHIWYIKLNKKDGSFDSLLTYIPSNNKRYGIIISIRESNTLSTEYLQYILCKCSKIMQYINDSIIKQL